VLTVAIVVGLVLVISGGSTDLKGQLTIYGSVSSGRYGTGHCSGSGGYSDIGEGSQVNVYDASGDLVATGDLDPGNSVTGDGLECTFSFAVADVPSGETLQVEVSHRGKVTVTADEVESGTVLLSLG
jgi:hypothetical protein